jgi:hypothetical protein
MRVEKGLMVPLGYGKYFRSESIIGLEPIEENRGPGMRTRVYVDGRPEAIVASRSDAAILRDLTGEPDAAIKSQQQQQLLHDILDSLSAVNPLLRSIIRDQGGWDLDRLEERIKDAIEDVPEFAGHN